MTSRKEIDDETRAIVKRGIANAMDKSPPAKIDSSDLLKEEIAKSEELYRKGQRSTRMR
jgi:hypothetical protein